jgi:hypothetical protein
MKDSQTSFSCLPSRLNQDDALGWGEPAARVPCQPSDDYVPLLTLGGIKR